NYMVGEGQKPSGAELEVFDKLIISMEEQLHDFNQNKNINSKVKENLEVFSSVLMNIKKNREEL
ncbi:hypothetical protein KAI65_01715, partial [Candidatus Parcubacteria bacterium]|nr:hypothetical protein [Candidatus Parcubacteria bacterium]